MQTPVRHFCILIFDALSIYMLVIHRSNLSDWTIVLPTRSRTISNEAQLPKLVLQALKRPPPEVM